MSDAADFARLAKRLKDAGETGLRRELYGAITDAAEPFKKKITDAEWLKPYMPDRYAEVLANDERVTVLKTTRTRQYGVSIRVQGRLKRREVVRINQGILRHPVFADSKKERKDWTWRQNDAAEGDGMKVGYFTDAAIAEQAAIARDIRTAMDRVGRQVTGG